MNIVPVNVARVQQVVALLREVRDEAMQVWPLLDKGEGELDGAAFAAYGDLHDLLDFAAGDAWSLRDAVWEVLQAADEQEAGDA